MMTARIPLVVGVVALALGTAVIAGCTGGPPKGAVDPGVEVGLLGGVEVVGYLVSSDGTSEVLDADPTAVGGAEPTVLATLVPGSVDEAGIEALDGRYVWAAGTSPDAEADTPEIEVNGIDSAVEPE